MTFDIQDFAQVFAPNDYIEVGFKQDTQSIAQLEKLLAKMFNREGKYQAENTKKLQHSIQDAIKELDKKNKNDISDLKKLFGNIGKNIDSTLDSSSNQTRQILQFVAKTAEVALKAVESQYKASKNFV